MRCAGHAATTNTDIDISAHIAPPTLDIAPASMCFMTNDTDVMSPPPPQPLSVRRSNRSRTPSASVRKDDTSETPTPPCRGRWRGNGGGATQGSGTLTGKNMYDSWPGSCRLQHMPERQKRRGYSADSARPRGAEYRGRLFPALESASESAASTMGRKATNHRSND